MTGCQSVSQNLAAYVAIDSFCVRPVGLYGNDVEAVVLDEVTSDLGAGSIEFWGTVGSIVDEENLAIVEFIELRAKCYVCDRWKRVSLWAEAFL
jgi:hypothetical protein